MNAVVVQPDWMEERVGAHGARRGILLRRTARSTIKFMIIIIVLRSRCVRAYFPQHNNLLHSFGCHCLSSAPIYARIHQSNTCSLFVWRRTNEWVSAALVVVNFYSSIVRHLVHSSVVVHLSGSTFDVWAHRIRNLQRREKKKTRNFVPDSAWHIYVYFNCIRRRNCR